MTKENKQQQGTANQDLDNETAKNGNPGGRQTDGRPDVNMAEDEAKPSDNPAEAAEAENEWKDKYLRLSAEFDNYRKRTHKEKMDLLEFGGERVITALLPVLDDMDRAMNAISSAGDVEALRTGVELIIQKLKDTLGSHGLAEIDCLGKELDTDFHEAVAKMPVEKKGQRGKILDTAQKGYKLKNKVIRHAKVVVGE